ncbi:hypothetical protein GCM10009816_16000 [Microbacterium aquimaris]
MERTTGCIISAYVSGAHPLVAVLTQAQPRTQPMVPRGEEAGPELVHAGPSGLSGLSGRPGLPASRRPAAIRAGERPLLRCGGEGWRAAPPDQAHSLRWCPESSCTGAGSARVIHRRRRAA